MTAWVGTLSGLAMGAFEPSSCAHGALDACNQLTDAELMQRYRNGDAEAFRHLYLRHRDRLYRYALRLARNAAEADELFQEVWLAVVRNGAGYRPSAKFVTYLFAIAHRRMIDVLRRRARAGENMQAGIEEAEQVADESFRQPQEIALLAENQGAMNAAIARLPIMQREAFLMQAIGDMTLDEIADATSTGRETVKSRLRYACARLRRELEAAR